MLEKENYLGKPPSQNPKTIYQHPVIGPDHRLGIARDWRYEAIMDAAGKNGPKLGDKTACFVSNVTSISKKLG